LPTFAILGLGTLAASTSSIWIRFAQTEAPSLTIAAFRLLIATLLLLPFFLVARRRGSKGYSLRLIGLGSLAGLFLALHFATWITSLEFTSVASSVALVQTTPLIVAVLSPLLLSEFPTRVTIFGILIALFGSLVITISDICVISGGFSCPGLVPSVGGRAVQGDLLALAGAAFGALYLIIGRDVRSEVTLIDYVTLIYGVAAIFLIGLAWITQQQMTGFQPPIYLWFLLLALLPQLFAHSTYNWALKYLPATVVSVFLLGEPVAATVLAFLILNETPSAVRISGAVLVLIGIAISTVPKDTPQVEGS
jgi:drug/metabolite transporter (DMT)-like permease